MSIKPILFNTEMVRAILDGRKVVTRRLIKLQPKSRLCYTYAGNYKVGTWGYPSDTAHEFWGEEYKLPNNIAKEDLAKRWNPPCHTDDILYVRETWQKAGLVDDFDQVVDGTEKYYYAAGPEKPYFDFWVDPETGEHKDRMPWRPSIHMPKEAARIWLKVTNVRVERLQKITDDGCIAEGVYPSPCRKCNATFGCDTCPDEGYNETDGFSELWNSTIKKSDLDVYGWLANPYVWVVEFERCEKPPECILKGYDKAPDDGLKCLGYMYDDNRDELIPMCKKCSYQASYENEEEK
jgi:hypothetical protein